MGCLTSSFTRPAPQAEVSAQRTSGRVMMSVRQHIQGRLVRQQKVRLAACHEQPQRGIAVNNRPRRNAVEPPLASLTIGVFTAQGQTRAPQHRKE